MHRRAAATAEDEAPAQRERARAGALEVMRVRLDVGSELELEARLAAVDGMIRRHVDAALRPPAPAPAGKK